MVVEKVLLPAKGRRRIYLSIQMTVRSGGFDSKEVRMPRSELSWNAPAKHEPETVPVAMEINAFCERHTVGRSKAYGLIADGSLVAKKMG